MLQNFKTNIQNSDLEVINELIKDLINLINVKLNEHKELFIALSGGSTPQLLFKTIAEKHMHEFPWEKMHFFWVDERCVPHESTESNYGNAYRILLHSDLIPKQNLHPVKGDNKSESERVRYGAEISSVLPNDNGIPTFDIIVLGMGVDGHTASIFPGQEYLFACENNCAISMHPESGQKRITLTGKIINNAKNTIVLVTGESKAEKVKIALHTTASSRLPIQLVQPTNGNITWYLDKDAAGLI
jgi:6-phosphogluconolactonase